jgi:hypothetical protein
MGRKNLYFTNYRETKEPDDYLFNHTDMADFLNGKAGMKGPKKVLLYNSFVTLGYCWWWP